MFLFFVFAFTACQKSEKKSDSFDILGLSDETNDAVKLIDEANEKLKEIKKIYVESKPKIEELKTAMQNKDIENVKNSTQNLVDKINNGVAIGEEAYTKIDQASNMKINEKFQDYLNLKKTSLRKQLDAFDFRRQNARLLRDAFGTKDDKTIEKAKADFLQKEDNFKQYMIEAKRISLQANALAITK
ncbi:MAG: hypothetical protein MUC29_13840 [Pyrinomonadaceae bacterium]|nr:hypothetical protein [Pyrinomonadaceae bacterium]